MKFYLCTKKITLVSPFIFPQAITYADISHYF
uniref:Uncharacterized protein n=1 Tax=Anguilla anguilla TaxID=7936 RepID=A0A0E9SAK5_ANGAN